MIFFFNNAHFVMTQNDWFLQCVAHIIRNSDLFKFLLYLVHSGDIINNIYYFLTVCDNSVMTYVKN